MSVAGLLLAAGAGRRFGRPKALADTGDGPWVLRALRTLHGLHPQVVVVGAAGDQVAALLPVDVLVVHNTEAASGMGSSLRVGLAALSGVDAVLITLVDLPDVGAEVTRRVVDAAPVTPATLRRASFGGRPGHPVLLGAEHWDAVGDVAIGDHGARDYLATQDVVLVECGDLSHGRDRDRPEG